MDNDDLRRGVPTNHKVYGEALAILAGDAMVTMAFEIIARDADPKLVPALVQELAVASGPEGMIGGQVLDMDGETRSLPLPDLQRVHRLKTEALLTSSCRLGVIAAGAAQGHSSPPSRSLAGTWAWRFRSWMTFSTSPARPNNSAKPPARTPTGGKTRPEPARPGREPSRSRPPACRGIRKHQIDRAGCGRFEAFAQFVVERNV